MIDFSKKNSLYISFDDRTDRPLLNSHSNSIHVDLSVLSCNYFTLGAHLIDLWKSNLYRIFAEDSICINSSDNCSSSVFFAYCAFEFDLDKSQVSRYMNIVSEFGDKQLIGFAPRWKDYSYSQLVEMLPLTEEQRKEIKSDWTIKQIREYKKTLVATSQQAESEVEPEAKPLDPKYERFAKYSKNKCIDIILDLEDQNNTLFARVLELEAQLATADFKIVKKLAVCN